MTPRQAGETRESRESRETRDARGARRVGETCEIDQIGRIGRIGQIGETGEAGQTGETRETRETLPWLAGAPFLAPALVALIVCVAAPVLVVTAISITDWSPGAAGRASFVGLRHYRELLASPDVMISVRNTLLLNAIVVPASFCGALAIALALTSLARGAAFWRVLYFLPVTSNLVAMAVVWQYLLHPELGLAAHALRAAGLTPINWLNDRSTVLWVVGAISTWQLLGYYVVLFVAGLVNIPAGLYEAARMDGARRAVDRFLQITWPMLAPTSLFVLVVTIVKSFQVFDVVQVLTKGGPDKASEVILYTLYQEGFVFFRTGPAAALATLFCGVMLVLTLLQMRALGRRVHYR